MRQSVWVSLGMCSVALAVIGWVASAQPTYSGQPGNFSAGGELITNFQQIDGGGTQVVMVDPQTRVMSVYHIGAAGEEKGKIQLKSVRPFRWDMEMNHYKTGEPLPQDLRNAEDRRQ